MCPELMNPEEYGLARTNPTKESDIYSLGMVIYEVSMAVHPGRESPSYYQKVFSGAPPFSGLRDATVIHRVLSGSRPEKLHGADILGFTERLWETTEMCWRERWQERPVIATVFKILEEEANAWVPPPPILNEGADDDNYSYVEAISSRFLVGFSECRVDCLPISGDLPGSQDSDQQSQSDSVFSTDSSQGTGLPQYSHGQDEGSEFKLPDPSTATAVDGTASSIRETDLSARAMHQGRSLSAGSAGKSSDIELVVGLI
jgi:hypothetical protein